MAGFVFRVDSECYVAPPPGMGEIMDRIERIPDAAMLGRREVCDMVSLTSVAAGFMRSSIYPAF